LTRLGFSVNESQLIRYQNATNNIRNSADGAASSFRNMFAGFVGFSALKSIIHTADEMQMLQARVAALPQTIGSAVDAFDEVGAHANAAGAKIETYATLYARIGSAARDVIPTQEKLLDVVDTISKAIATSGASATQQKSAFYQLSEAFNMNSLQGIHLKALETDVPEFMHAIGDSMGYTSEQFKDAASEGKITAAVLAKAIENVKLTFDARFNKLPFTFSRALIIMQNRYAQFINKLNNESGAVPKISKMFSDFFDGVFNGLNKLVKELDGGGQALKIFGLALAAALGPAAMKIALGGLRLLFSRMMLLFLALFVTSLAISDLYTWFQGGDSIIGDWLGNIRKANGQLDNMKIAIAGVTGTLGLLFLFAPIATFKKLWVWIPTAVMWLGRLTTALLTASLAELGFTWPLWLIVLAITAVLAIAYLLYKFLTGDFNDVKKVFSDIADAFGAMTDRMIKYWKDFKDFYSFGFKDLGLGSAFPQPQLSGGIQKLMTSSPSSNTQAPITVTVTQNLSPGTTPEIADRANSGFKDAIDNIFGVGHIARQMNQVSP
jgi:tape measure domain-containing protein